MTTRMLVRSFAVLGVAAMIGGCGAPADDGSPGTSSSALTLAPMPALTVPTLPPALTLTPVTTPIPILLTPTRPPICKNPNYVLIVKDEDGYPYGAPPNEVPFPTPWATGEPARYEQLIAGIKGHLDYEYLVRNVEVVNGMIRTSSDHQYFFVGWPEDVSADIDPEYQQLWIDAYQTPSSAYPSYHATPGVEAQVIPCVQLVTSSDGLHVTNVPGGYFSFGDEHDPSHHPT